MQIFEIVLQYLITEYVDYAIDLGIQSVPIPESNTQQPDIYFFEIVQQTNIIVHLLEKLIQDCLFPLIEWVVELWNIEFEKYSKLVTSFTQNLSFFEDLLPEWVIAYQEKSAYWNKQKWSLILDLIGMPRCITVIPNYYFLIFLWRKKILPPRKVVCFFNCR